MPEFQTSDGLSLYYEVRGEGEPVLCLAGLTRNVRDFDFLAPHLKGWQMIALDSRGRGNSDFDPTYANYNVMRESQDVVELLDHLGIAKTWVIGTSRGGLLAMMLAAGHRDRLRGVVLNDVGPVVDAGGISRIVAYVGQPPQERSLNEAAENLATVMGKGFPGVDLLRWREVAAANFREDGDGLALRYDPLLRQALVEQLDAGPVGDVWPLFDALKGLPLGVLRGANSDILTEDTLAQMRVHNPEMKVATVPDRAHVPFLDEPQSVELIHQVLNTK
ncbi:MAG: alpha/beta fold hydrolase [Arenibacterium sp.]